MPPGGSRGSIAVVLVLAVLFFALEPVGLPEEEMSLMVTVELPEPVEAAAEPLELPDCDDDWDLEVELVDTDWAADSSALWSQGSA